MIAFHPTSKTLRNGEPIPPIGTPLIYTGPLVMCSSGLHASKQPFDVLQYASANTKYLHMVWIGGQVEYGIDKLVCSERTILATIECNKLNRKFACDCALDVIHLWDAPAIVIEYLQTQDESLRAAVTNAAAAAAYNTSNAASYAAYYASYASNAAYAYYAAYYASKAANATYYAYKNKYNQLIYTQFGV